MINFHSDIKWNKVVPLNVPLLAWRVINIRIPTKDNLFCYGGVLPRTTNYTGGCGNEEMKNQ